MRRSVSALSATLVSALALSACGGSSDSDKIKSVIKDVGKDPATLCTKHATAQILQQVGGEAACVKLAAQPDAKDPGVKVGKVDVNGDKATAEVTSNSGPDKGRTSKVSFAKQGGEWKISGLGS
jgi:ABC-type glycerol-3-phosphate transport system substrate-binding protein